MTNLPLNIPISRRPEIDLSMTFEQYRLAAKIDLLAVDRGKQAVIVDWKTTHKSPKPAFVTSRIQSLVYPYLVISTGSSLNGYKPFDPSQVTMIYWYPSFPEKPVILKFDQIWMEKTKSTLSRLVGEIAHLKMDIFPLTVETGKCQFCRFRSLCERGITAGNLASEDMDESENEKSLEINFDEIQGIAF